MKIAIVCDTHFGARVDSQFFQNKFTKFYEEKFFPYLEENNITTIVHLGDLVDRQKYLNYLTASTMKKSFLDPLKQRGYNTIFIQGNHDSYFKNTNEISAIDVLVSEYGFNIYKEPTEISIAGFPVFLIPWIPKDEEAKKKALSAIQDTKAQIAMGHLEIVGFEMFKGTPAMEGMDRKIFSKFDKVFSGHFHHRSQSDNIHYLGTPYQFMWSDADQIKGFHIFDLETRELTFVPNDDIVFKKIVYNDKDLTLDKIMDFPFNDYNQCIVKLIVSNKDNPYWFDLFVEQLENAGVEDLLTVDDHQNQSEINDEEVASELDDTLSIFKKRINQTVEETNKRKRLTKLITELYKEAETIE